MEKLVENNGMGKKKFKTVCDVLYYVIPFIILGIAIYTAFNKVIWADEVFSMELAKHSFIELIQIDARDVHPPLYYLILRLAVLLFGKTANIICIGKLVSIIPYILLLIIGFTYIRNKYGDGVSFLFNLFIVGMPNMLSYATEIRMYSWSTLFVTCAFLQLPLILTEEKENTLNYILLTIFSALSAYTHYFACVSAIAVYIEIFVLFLRKRNYIGMRKTLFSGIGVVVLFIPWFIVFISQLSTVSGSYWIEPVSFFSVVDCILYLFSSKLLIEIVVILIFLSGIVGMTRCSGEERNTAICAIGVWLGTIIIGVVLSLIIRPIFVPRYLMGSAACLWLGTAIGVNQLFFNKRVKTIFLVIIVGICSLISVKYLKFNLYQSNNYKMTITCLEDYIDDDIVLLSDYNHIQMVGSFLYPQNMNLVYKDKLSELTRDVYSDCTMGRINNISELKDYKKGRLIVLDDNMPLNNGEDPSLKEELEKAGYEPKLLGDFWIDWYYFKMYVVE